MNETEKMLKDLARKTMFDVSMEEMNLLLKEYNVFMRHVKALEAIDTQGVEPLAFPYEEEIYFLREDEVGHTLEKEEVLSNAPSIQDGQIKVPKVVDHDKL